MRKTWTVGGRERVPVDAVAARVTSPGVEYVSSKRIVNETWDAPPPLAPLPDGLEDMTGSARGRMALVGYLRRDAGTGKHKWLARCACGRHETRDAITWRRGVRVGAWDGCQHCRQAIFLRKRDYFLRHGENAPDEAWQAAAPQAVPVTYWGGAALRKHSHGPARLMGAESEMGKGQRELIHAGYLACPSGSGMYSLTTAGIAALASAQTAGSEQGRRFSGGGNDAG